MKANKYTQFLQFVVWFASVLLAPYAMGAAPYNLYRIEVDDYCIPLFSPFGTNKDTGLLTGAPPYIYSSDPLEGCGPFVLKMSPDYRFLYKVNPKGYDYDERNYVDGSVVVYGIVDGYGSTQYNSTTELNKAISIELLAVNNDTYAYVVTSPDGDDYLYAYSIDPGNGSLSLLSDTKVKVGGTATSAISSQLSPLNDVIVYVGTKDGYVQQFKGGSDGVLLSSAVSSPKVSGAIQAVISDPGYDFLYVIADDVNVLKTEDNYANSVATKQSLSGYKGLGAVLSPDGNMLYVSTTEPGIIAYSIDRVNGFLTEVNKSTLLGMPVVNGLVMDAGAKFVYVSTENPVSITTFKVDESSRKLVQSSYTDGDYFIYGDNGVLISPMHRVYNENMSITPDSDNISVNSATPQEIEFEVQSNTGYDLLNVKKVFNIVGDGIQVSIIDDQCGSKIGMGGYCTITAKVTTTATGNVTGSAILHVSGNYEYYAQDGVNLMVTDEVYDYPSVKVNITESP